MRTRCLMWIVLAGVLWGMSAWAIAGPVVLEQEGLWSFVSEGPAESQATVETLLQFNRLDFTAGAPIYLASLSRDRIGGQGLDLVLEATRSNFYGTYWQLRLKGDGLLPANQLKQGENYIELAAGWNLIEAGHKYKSLLSYDGTTGMLAVQFTDVTSAKDLHQGYRFAQTSSGQLFGGVSWQHPEADALGLESFVFEKEAKRVGGAVALKKMNVRIGSPQAEFLCFWNSDLTVRIDGIKDELPGTLRCVLCEPEGVRNSELFSLQVTEASGIHSLGKRILPPGKYQGIVEYVTPEYREEVARVDWEVIGPVVNAILDVRPGVDAPELFEGVISLSSNQLLENIQVALIAKNGNSSDVVLARQIDELSKKMQQIPFDYTGKDPLILQVTSKQGEFEPVTITKEWPYEPARGVGTWEWESELGNHRTRVRVDAESDAVWARIPWRLYCEPGTEMVIVNGATGKRIRDFVVINVNREYGDVVFRPENAPGEYYVYYMIYESLAADGEAEQGPDANWLKRHNLTINALSSKKWMKLPRASVVGFEARTDFDLFGPMGITATKDEVRELLGEYHEPLLVFPEDREHPIRMKDVPLRWISKGLQGTFAGTAKKNEFYVFQLGVYTNPQLVSAPVEVCIETSDLTGPSNGKIDRADICCFNTGGVDYLGQTFEKTWEAVPGEVGTLWFGIQVPLDATSGQYKGQITLRSQGRSYPIDLVLDVTEEVAADQGMDDPYRMARLKWLNSSLGQEDTITAPYIPLQVSGNTVTALMGNLEINSLGFPEKIRASSVDILSEPITMEVRKSRGVISWQTEAAQVVEATASRVVWESNSTSDEMQMNVVGTMEFDGGICYDVTFTANKKVTLDTINFNVPLVKEQVPYMSGIGRIGGYRPSRWSWFWSQQPDAWAWRGNNLEYFAWLGDVDAGLYIRLKSPLDDWRNNLNGFVALSETTSGDVLFRAQTGHRNLVAGETIQLSFKLMPTPIKPRDPSIWNTRYAHGHRSMDLLVNSGANVLNIHHSHPGNYWINYPFLNLDTLVPYINEAHGHGIKVKLYYTLRELTTRLPELWAFRSLGDEIYRVGGEQAHGSKELDAWLREHLVDGYAGGWITNTAAGIDPSIRTVRQSRLENFYVEGLAWLLENIKADGIYLDEIGYTPETIRRVRRVMDAIRPGSMIDVHSHYTAWSNQSPLAYYLEHMPYVDRLWLGEEFNPDNPPEFWLIEMSGIPFGLSNDLLQDPNPWRGMLYGMTPRAEYASNPKVIWEVWDDFGIDQAVMKGYWEDDCPVVANDKDVLATAYVKEGTTLISLASWAKNDRECHLSIDWEALGLSAEKAVLVAPGIERFQGEATFRPGEPIPVPTGKGWLLILKEE